MILLAAPLFSLIILASFFIIRDIEKAHRKNVKDIFHMTYGITMYKLRPYIESQENESI